jgi:hypothetical protein
MPMIYNHQDRPAQKSTPEGAGKKWHRSLRMTLGRSGPRGLWKSRVAVNKSRHNPLNRHSLRKQESIFFRGLLDSGFAIRSGRNNDFRHEARFSAICSHVRFQGFGRNYLFPRWRKRGRLGGGRSRRQDLKTPVERALMRGFGYRMTVVSSRGCLDLGTSVGPGPAHNRQEGSPP